MPVFSSRSLTALILAGVLAPLAGCDRQSGDAAQPAASATASVAADEGIAPAGMLDETHKGSAMPDLVFSDPAGKELRLASLRGKPLLVNLWATWCGPCVVEMPMLDALAGQQAGKLKVLTVSQDFPGAGADKVAPLFAAKKFKHLEPWLDPDNAMSDHYQTGTLPTTILYGADGKELWRVVGAFDWSGAKAKALLAKAS